MNPITLWTLLFAAICLLAAPLALWLFLHRSRHSLAGAIGLALLATTGGVMAWNLQFNNETQAATAAAIPFTLKAGAPGQFQTIAATTLDQALQAARGKPVILEFYADWCTSCQVWKQQVFSRRDVQATLKPFVLLRIDATAVTPEVQASLNRFDLVGLPAIISFDSRGRELPKLRLLGEMPAPAFMHWVRDKLESTATL